MSRKTSVPLVFLLCLALLALVVTEDQKGCIGTFSDLQKSLLSREANLDSLTKAFFPVNRQTSITVEIYYYMSSGNLSTVSSLEALDYDYKFRWTLSSVHVFIRPTLLECLSLYIYRPYTIVARVIVDPMCSGEEIDANKSDSVCSETKYMDTEAGTPVHLLNELTTHLKSYVLYQRVHEDTRGHVAYYYNRDYSEDYCVIGYDAVYAANRLILNLSAVFLLFFLGLGIPATFAYSYDTLFQYVKKKPNAQYFIWAVVMGTIVLYPLIFATDVWILRVRGFNESSGRVLNYYIVFLTIGIILPILDIICVLLLWFLRPEIFKKDFPIPHPTIDHCSYSCHSSRGPIVIQIAAVILFTLCIQHLSFHGVYILLGFAASPLQATSLLAFYITATFCMVSFFAVVLKVIDIKTFKGWKAKTCIKQLVPLLMVILFVGFVSCFIAFYIRATIIIGEYRNDGGFTSFVASLAPSAMLSLLGFVGKKFVDFDMTKNKKTSDDGETAGQSAKNNEAIILENVSVAEELHEDNDGA